MWPVVVFHQLWWQTSKSLLGASVKPILLLAAMCVAASAQTLKPEDIQVGSEAEIWLQRSKQDKVGYLEGLCTGFAAGQSNLSHSVCAGALPSMDLSDGKGNTPRLCGLVNGFGLEKAIAHMDSFYRQRHHTDLPIWAAVASYNDKACGEQTAPNAVLTRMQKRGECFRNYTNVALRLAPEAKKKQLEYCQSLPER